MLEWVEDNDLVDPAEVEAARVVLVRRLDAVLAEVSQHRQPGPVVDLADKLSQISEHWSPKVVATLNDYEIKLVKLRGEFVWHTHDETDELFLVLDGRLTIQLRDRDVTLGPGQLFVVPAGVEHRPVADGDVAVLLVEPEGVVNTGDAGGELTAAYGDSLRD